MKNKLLYIILGAIIIITILVIIFIPKSSNTDNNNVFNKENIISMGNYNEILVDQENYVISNYTEYNDLFDNNELKEDSFKHNNYVVIQVEYNPCSEEEVNISNYTIKNSNITVTVDYKAKCGLCAPQYKYYLLKVDKELTNVVLNIEYNKLNNPHCDSNVTYKPMIYLYPTKETNVTVKLGYPDKLITTYPKYNKEWKVTAKPNGDILYNDRLYYGLYWEGKNTIKEEYNDGFVVNKENIIPFLEEKLEILGLNQKEINEFIIYWLPTLERNNYNLIRFETSNVINEQMPLTINPKPDSIIRVFMAFKPLDNRIKIKEQKLKKQTRKGFSVVEWGGSLIY